MYAYKVNTCKCLCVEGEGCAHIHVYMYYIMEREREEDIPSKGPLQRTKQTLFSLEVWSQELTVWCGPSR